MKETTDSKSKKKVNKDKPKEKDTSNSKDMMSKDKDSKPKEKDTKSSKIKAEEDSNNNVESKMKDGVKQYLEKAKLKEEMIFEDDKEKALSREGIYSFFGYYFFQSYN